MTAKIKETLQNRGSRYGSFEDNAKITQALCDVLKGAPNYSKLQKEHLEAFHMIFHKIARAVCGDPDYVDNIHDIIGYATLLENFLVKKFEKNCETEETLRNEVQMLKNAASGKLGKQVDLTGLVSEEAVAIFLKEIIEGEDE